MASIGSTSCSIVRAQPPRLKARTSVYQIGGIDGYGAHIIGKGDGEFQIIAELFDTPANLETWHQELEDAQGSVVIVTNDFNVAYANILLRQVGKLQKRPTANAPGGIGVVRISAVTIGDHS